jgi:outer membrane immunogenic protein
MALAASRRSDVAVGLSLVLLFLSSAGTAFAQNVIGSTVAIEGDVSAMRGGRTRHLAAGDSVFSDENIRTSNKSTAKLRFLDQSNLTIGPSASVVDRSPSKREAVIRVASSVIEVTSGAARWVSGESHPRPNTITTPHATIGVRGTSFDLLVEPRRTVITLRSGQIAVCIVSAPRRCVTLDAPQQVVIVTASTIVGPSPGGPSETFFAENCLSPIDRAACVIPALPPQVQSIRPSRRVQSIRPSVSQVRPGLSPTFSAPATATNWTGLYVGGNAGYEVGPSANTYSTTVVTLSPIIAMSRPTITAPASAQVTAIPANLGLSPKGWVPGGQIGYNQQFGSWLAGAEVAFSWSDVHASGLVNTGPVPIVVPGFPVNTVLVTTAGNITMKDFGTVRGRLGFLPTPTWLLYATGGLAWGQIESNATVAETITGPCFAATCVFNPGFGSASSWRTGWTVGGGAEWMLAPNLTFKAEYLYYNLGGISYGVGPLVSTSGGVPFTTLGMAVSTNDIKGSIARVGVNYLFNAGPGGAHY